MAMHLSTNPSSGVTRLTFLRPNPEKLSVRIVDQQGRTEKVAMTFTIAGNKHEIEWQSRDLPFGMYFIYLHSGQFSATQKYPLFH